MTDRIHMVVDALEKERYRRLAARAGQTLSEWLREAANDKAATVEAMPSLGGDAALLTFFATCDARERGVEPDWTEHREVIERSAATGSSRT